MTHADIDNMNDSEIAEAVARGMGWERVVYECRDVWHDGNSHLDDAIPCAHFDPCNEMGCAMLAIDWLIDTHADCFSVGKDDGEYEVELSISIDDDRGYSVIKKNRSFGRAVCEALLHALAESEVGDAD